MSHISITHCVASLNPFDAVDADVVLRTADGECLRVYRRILQESSPFFSDLFSLPQPQSEVDADTPIIDVDEQALLMKTLLLLIYPGEEPPIGTLNELSAVVAVAMKYQMVRAVATLRRLLISPRFVEKHPTQVYAIACRHDFEEEARIASKYTLNVNILDCPLSDDLKYITAFSYHRLLDLHRKRGYAAQALLVCEDDVKVSIKSHFLINQYTAIHQRFVPLSACNVVLPITEDYVRRAGGATSNSVPEKNFGCAQRRTSSSR